MGNEARAMDRGVNLHLTRDSQVSLQIPEVNVQIDSVSTDRRANGNTRPTGSTLRRDGNVHFMIPTSCIQDVFSKRKIDFCLFPLPRHSVRGRVRKYRPDDLVR